MPLADAPQSNRQHAVPQNIMDVEFKLVGDLTMRQFSYLLILGLLAYFSYVIIPGIFKWPLTLFLALLALALAFVPVQERGLDEWLVNFFRSINSPTQRIWKKEPQLPTAFLYDNLAVVRQEMITLAPTSSRRKLEDYLRRGSGETVEDPLDIPEKSYIAKVREAYPDMPKSSGVGVMLDDVPYEQMPSEEPNVDDYGPVLEEQEPVKVEAGEVIEKDIEQKETPEISVGVSKVAETKEPVVEKKIVSAPAKSDRPKIINRKSTYNDIRRGFGSRRSGVSGEFNVGKGSSFQDYGFITPDMHSGRKFVNLVPSDGHIILPIRGERVLDTSESVQVKMDIEDKAKKLKDLLEKIRAEEGIPIKKIPDPVVKEKDVAVVVDEQAQDVADKLKEQNEGLADEIQRLKGQIERGKSMSMDTNAQEQLLKKLEKQKEEIASSYMELRSQVQDLQKKLSEKITSSQVSDTSSMVNVNLPVLTNSPNVVTGVVRDSEGKFFSNILLIIKNSRGDTVRAFKTNSLGQFVVSTPLQNGTYTIEVSPSNKTGRTFGIIPIEVKGEVLPTLEIIGK